MDGVERWRTGSRQTEERPQREMDVSGRKRQARDKIDISVIPMDLPLVYVSSNELIRDGSELANCSAQASGSTPKR